MRVLGLGEDSLQTGIQGNRYLPFYWLFYLPFFLPSTYPHPRGGDLLRSLWLIFWAHLCPFYKAPDSLVRPLASLEALADPCSGYCRCLGHQIALDRRQRSACSGALRVVAMGLLDHRLGLLSSFFKAFLLPPTILCSTFLIRHGSFYFVGVRGGPQFSCFSLSVEYLRKSWLGVFPCPFFRPLRASFPQLRFCIT